MSTFSTRASSLKRYSKSSTWSAIGRASRTIRRLSSCLGFSPATWSLVLWQTRWADDYLWWSQSISSWSLASLRVTQRTFGFSLFFGFSVPPRLVEQLSFRESWWSYEQRPHQLNVFDSQVCARHGNHWNEVARACLGPLSSPIQLGAYDAAAVCLFHTRLGSTAVRLINSICDLHLILLVAPRVAKVAVHSQ